MPRQITLPGNTRTFTKTGPQSSLLARTGKYIAAGTTLDIGEPCSMIYDHRDQVVVPILHPQAEGQYFILSEIGIPEPTN